MTFVPLLAQVPWHGPREHSFAGHQVEVSVVSAFLSGSVLIPNAPEWCQEALCCTGLDLIKGGVPWKTVLTPVPHHRAELLPLRWLTGF